MVEDVRKSLPLIGRSPEQIDSLLGKPDFVEGHRHMYTLVTDYGWDIDPRYLKYFVLTFDEDSIVTSHEIEEIDHDH